MKKKVISVVLAAIMMLTLLPTVTVFAAENLIKNGSFEDYMTDKKSGTYFHKDSTLNSYWGGGVSGWEIVGNKYLELHVSPITFIEGNYRASGSDGGKVNAELNVDICAPATISQTFNTTPGDVLTVSFALAARKGFPCDMSVSMGKPGSQTKVATYTESSLDWKYKSFDYTVPAGQTSTKISFSSNNGNKYSAGNDLDDVKVVVKTPVGPTVTTGNATNITSNTAVIASNTYTGGSGVSTVGVQFGTNSNLSGGQMVPGTLTSPFNVNLANLSANTNYYYRAYAYANGQYYYGSIKSFCTTQAPAPTVTTGTAGSITSNSAVISNNTYANAPYVSYTGIQYGTNANLSGAPMVYGSLTTPFSVNLANLNGNTTYYYRAFIYTNGQFYYGSTKDFCTSQVQAPKVVTGTAGSITNNSAVISNNTYAGANYVSYAGVQYSTNSSMASAAAVYTSTSTPFSADLVNLTGNTNYYYRAFIYTNGQYYYGDIKTFCTSQIQAPTVVTGTAVNITTSSATISNNTYSGAGYVSYAGIQYATNPTLANAYATYGSTSNPFSIDIANLTANTTYYYRAFIYSNGQYYYGETKNFATTPGQQVKVVTGTAGSITASSATISNNTYSGTSYVSYAGVQYGTDAALAGANAAYSSTSTPFSADLANLSANTTYYYRAFIYTNGQYVYGDIKNFKTSPGQTVCVYTGTAEGITANSARISNNTYTGASYVSYTGIQYGTNSSLTGATPIYGSIANPFSVDIANLSQGTTYYYRAFIYTSGQYVYGDIKSFTTLQGVTPTVVSGVAGSLTPNSAVISNNTYTGMGATPSNVGVQYSESPSGDGLQTVYGSVGSPFSTNLTNLKPDTTYYYRAFVLSGGNYYFGEIKSFKTPAGTTCTVVTGTAGSITKNSAVVTNNSFTGITNASSVGVEYGTNSSLSGALTSYAFVGSPFSANISGLSDNTTYYYRAVVDVNGQKYYGAIKNFKTLDGGSGTCTVISGTATNVQPNSATIADSSYTNPGGTVYYVGVQYGTNSNLDGAQAAYGTPGTPFSVNLNGLTADKTYYYRAFIYVNGQYIYGDIKSFTTGKGGTVCTVSTGSASIIGTNDAMVVGNTYSAPYGTASYCGVQCSTNYDMTGYQLSFCDSANPFQVRLTNLQPNQTYYYRAWIFINNDYVMGDIKSFKTQSGGANDPQVYGGNAVYITSNSATIQNNSYSGDKPVTSVGVYLADNAGVTNPQTFTAAVSSPFSVNLSNLTPGATYYYQAFVKTSDGMTYVSSDVKNFTTLTGPGQNVEVNTKSASDITKNSAKLGASYNANQAVNLVGFDFADNPSFSNQTWYTAVVSSPYYSTATNLQSGKTYYYRGFIRTADGEYHFGDVLSFTTY